ncbi:hypothetical protein OO185_02570 [Prosthecochloris sp. SCSIO W1102]|uniref:hypothetical protein n=1 Tax=Prosthecochloris sp. SCSIO W1102 TaxID=2992243 RepID=UPI00223D5C9F|nr:hypothetical protein [Prosthecochloris sp. SCSIO W1102]UZJ40005.1 hypothetical protein OO185_02570 [Prosthecochloris sp. SCSIO W1102]
MDAATSGIVGSILGAIFGGLIAFVASIIVLRKQEQYRQRAKLTSEFIELQRLLKIRHPNHSIEYRPTYDLLRDNYSRLFTAILFFKQSLSRSKAKKFESKWHEICSFDLKHQGPTFEDYKVTGSNHEKEITVRDMALSRIQELLDIAKVR